MQAQQAVITAPRHVEFQPVEMRDPPSPGNALLRTRVSFISAGTELAMYAGTEPRIHDPAEGHWKYPYRPGYANVADVLAVGQGVTRVVAGQRVFTFAPHVSHHVFNLWDGDVIEPLPQAMDDETAAAARMATVAITALQVTDLQLGDWVVVFGLGAVGNLAAQLFQLAGCRVMGVDPVASRCQLAMRCGIEQVITAAGESAAQQIRQLIGARARDGDGKPVICVDAVGHSAIVAGAINLVAKHGQIIILGAPRAPYDANLSDLMRRAFSNWITIKGAMEWRLPRTPALDPHARHTTLGNLRLVFDLVQRGRLHVQPLISHRLPASEIHHAYEGLLGQKSEYTGVLLRWL